MAFSICGLLLQCCVVVAADAVFVGISVVVAPATRVCSLNKISRLSSAPPVGDSHKGTLNNQGKPTFFRKKTKRKRT
jgi:hypothetical protein